MALTYAIALTGGIASGKSSVANIFSSFAFHVIDADTIAHRILNEQHEAIATMFGKALITDPNVDRKALGKIVFSDPAKRKELEALLHPLIYSEIEQQALIQEAFQKPYIIDIPLFFESNGYAISKSLVVYAPKEKQLERLMRRDGYNRTDALSRIGSQISIEKKRNMATYIVDNSATLAQLQKKCEEAKEKILKDFS